MSRTEVNKLAKNLSRANREFEKQKHRSTAEQLAEMCQRLGVDPATVADVGELIFSRLATLRFQANELREVCGQALKPQDHDSLEQIDDLLASIDWWWTK